MPRKRKYDTKVHVAMTTDMLNKLLDVAGQRRKVPDQIRKFIRHGLDEQAEVAGSRRYFTGRFRDAVNLQRLEIQWYLTVFIVLVSQALSHIILGIYPDLPEEERKLFTGPALFRAAIAQAEEQGSRIQGQLADLITDKTLDQD